MNGVKHSWKKSDKSRRGHDEGLTEESRCILADPHPADKALRMPQRVESRDVVLQDGPGTAATLGGKHVKVVFPAVRLPVLLMESWRSTYTKRLNTHTNTLQLTFCLELYLLVQKRIHTEHRRSVQDATSCPEQWRLSVKREQPRNMSEKELLSTILLINR